MSATQDVKYEEFNELKAHSRQQELMQLMLDVEIELRQNLGQHLSNAEYRKLLLEVING